MIRASFLVLAAMAASATPAPAQPVSTRPPLSEVLRTSLLMHSYETAVSADGTRVAYVDSYRATERSQSRTTRLFAGLEGQAPAEIRSAAKLGIANPAWSPDGSRLAFLSGDEGGTPAIYVVGENGDGLRRLAVLHGAAQALRWAPDGSKLAMLYISQAHRKAGALAPGARDVGVIGSVNDEQRIATVDARTGAVTLVTPADSYVYEYDWSPASDSFACTYAKGNGDNNWWIAKLATVPARPNASLTDRLTPKQQINEPRWSPDGTRIAFIGGLMSDFGSVGGDVYVLDVRSGSVRDVTPGWKESAARIAFAGNQRLLVVAHVNGSERVQQLNEASGMTADVTSLPESISSFASSSDGRSVALVRSSFARAPEVWGGQLGRPVQLSHANAGFTAYYGRARSLNWSSDNFKVQGWLVYPIGYDPSNRYPLIEIVHGGPSAESTPTFDNRTVAALASRGYFVFMPNPRGSFGQGEAFTAANIKDFGYGDWRDDLSGIDAAIRAEPAVDANRLGMYGWSYGGYMTMWAETQTNRFRAIVSGAGVVNWQSYYGQNKIDQWMIPFFGASVYDDPAVYAKSSPITFIKNSKTPILILQGERDEEVPAPQAFEFYHAMQTLGVPSRLVVYADEGHSPQQVKNQLDIVTRIVGWFDRYVR